MFPTFRYGDARQRWQFYGNSHSPVLVQADRTLRRHSRHAVGHLVHVIGPVRTRWSLAHAGAGTRVERGGGRVGIALAPACSRTPSADEIGRKLAVERVAPRKSVAILAYGCSVDSTGRNRQRVTGFRLLGCKPGRFIACSASTCVNFGVGGWRASSFGAVPTRARFSVAHDSEDSHP